MTIFVTPFKTVDKQCTGPSVDSGFPDIDGVVAAMGDSQIMQSERMVIYGDDENRVIFSKDVTFHVDGDNNNG